MKYNPTDLGKIVDREIVMVKTYKPTEFQRISISVPSEGIVNEGRFIPTKYKRVEKYVPSNYQEFKVPIVITKY